jgi:hypothetical protein
LETYTKLPNMKIKATILLAMMLFAASYLFGQKKGDKGEPEKFSIIVGGTFAKPKIIPAMDRIALAQLRVNYKMTTTARAQSNPKKDDVIAGVKITASLETTDGQLTPADFQEVTNYFYSYFQKSLKDSGIDTVAWSKIAASDFYQSGADDTKEKTGDDGSSNVYFTSIANKGNLLYGGFIGFAFGKGKKATNFCEEMGAPAGFFNVTVEFADILIDIDVDTKESRDMYYITKTRSFKYNSAVKPNVKVIPGGQKGLSMFWNDKSQSEGLSQLKDMEGAGGYQTNMSQDASRMKNNPFRFAKEMTPVVIETTREQYKAAAKKALENYANEFIAMVNEKKKSS